MPAFIPLEEIHAFLGAVRKTQDPPKDRNLSREGAPIKTFQETFGTVPIYSNAYDIFPKILNGEYMIEHGAQANLLELQVWTGLWLWVYHFGGAKHISMDDAKRMLAEHQPEYKESTNETQLQYLKTQFYPSKRVASQLLHDYGKKNKII